MMKLVRKICSKCGCMFIVREGGIMPPPYDPVPVCWKCKAKAVKDVIDKVRGK